MSFQPVLPSSGLSGWAFLQRTRGTQQAIFNNSAPVTRDTEYFEKNISNIKTAEDLVADRRLLSIALGAYGLEADINNKFFIRKVLEDGTFETDALANRLSDKRYLAFSKAFGFGDFPVANTQLSDFPDKIINAFQDQKFETAIGDQDESMRLALELERQLEDVVDGPESKNTKWFQIMGTPTLRKVFETALGLPTSIGGLDLDLQLKTFKSASERVFGDPDVVQFSDLEKLDKLRRLFLVRSDIASGGVGYSPGQAALTLLQNSATFRAF